MTVDFSSMTRTRYNDSSFSIISEVAGITQMTFQGLSASVIDILVNELVIVLVLSTLVPL